MSDVQLRAATDADLEAIHRLLAAAELPIPEADEGVRFRVAASSQAMVAVNGWEAHEGQALLRSVVVADSERGRGVGGRLVADTLRAIEAEGIQRITLVTMDAAGFFERLGFVPIEQREVPAPIRSCKEYRIHECVGGQWMLRER